MTALKILQFLLAMVLVGAVLAFGGVEAGAIALTEAGIGAIGFLIFWSEGWPRLPWMATSVMAALFLWTWIQILPLPRGLVAAISPARAAMDRQILAPWGLVRDWITFSVQPHATLEAALRLTSYFLVFCVAVLLYRRKVPSILIPCLIGLGLFEAAYGLVQYLTGWQYIFTFQKKFYTDDATGTYINRNHFAGLLEMTLPFILAGLVISRAHLRDGARKWREILSSSSLHPLRNATLFGIVSLALVFSRSRMGLAAGLSGVLLVLLLGTARNGKRALWVAPLVLAMPIAYSLWIGLTPVEERFEVLSRAENRENDRLPLWRDALSLIRDQPWTGTGLGTYRGVSAAYQTNSFQWQVDHAHNDYLEFAAELGIPAALLLFGSLWVLVIQVSRRTWALERTADRVLGAGCAGALAALLMHSVTDFNLQIPANALLFAWVAGTATALLEDRRPVE